MAVQLSEADARTVDRANVNFVATGGMSKAIGLAATDFGFGAGIYFLGYFLFEPPSNLVLEKLVRGAGSHAS